VKTGDVSCSAPDPGGGGGAGPTMGDSGTSDTGSAEGASACGTAQEFFVTNTTCAPCIEGVSGLGCCGADLGCSQGGSASPCITLLQCMLTCTSTDLACPETCENTTPDGVQAYQEFAACLLESCSPECPVLPQPGTSDF
jgi:hypothetical protein